MASTKQAAALIGARCWHDSRWNRWFDPSDNKQTPILDVFSRFVVGWMVAERESGEFAKALIDETCERQGIMPCELSHVTIGATDLPIADC